MERTELLRKIVNFSENIESEDIAIRNALGIEGPMDPSDISDQAYLYQTADRIKYNEFQAFLDELPDDDIIFVAAVSYGEVYEEFNFDELCSYMKSHFERKDLIEAVCRKIIISLRRKMTCRITYNPYNLSSG